MVVNMATRHKGLGAASGSKGPPVAVYQGTVESESNLTAYTFSSQTIGGSATPHHVAVLIYSAQGFSASSATVTVDGESCTQLAFRGTGTTSANVGIYITNAATTATSGDVVVTWNSGRANCAIGVYSIEELSSTTPLDTATGTGTTLLSTLVTEDDGLILIACQDAGGSFSSSCQINGSDGRDGNTNLGGGRGTIGSSIDVPALTAPTTDCASTLAGATGSSAHAHVSLY